jgi:hypothetical protein
MDRPQLAVLDSTTGLRIFNGLLRLDFQTAGKNHVQVDIVVDVEDYQYCRGDILREMDLRNTLN